MIQGQLGTLVGKSSGYIESLPKQVRRRITALENIQVTILTINHLGSLLLLSFLH